MAADPTVSVSAGRLLNAVLSRHAELALNDTQLAALSRLYWGADGTVSIDQAVSALSNSLSPDQFRKAVAYFAQGEFSSTGSNAQTPNEVDALVTAALSRQTKDKDLVEVELAAKAAERIIGWARIFGYFVALPAGLILIIMTLFGVSKFEDVRTAADRVESQVTDAEQKLNLAVKNAQQSAQRADQLVAEINKWLADQDQKLANLNNKVDQLLSFGGAADLSRDLQSRLERLAEAYLNYFEKLGYAPKTPTINVSTKGAVSNFLSYFDPATNTIFVQPPVAEDQFVLLREYSHHILYSSLSFDALDARHSSNFSLVPIEYGLANYFPASYLGDPRLGAIAVRYMKSTIHFEKPFLFNLDNTEPVTTLVIKMVLIRILTITSRRLGAACSGKSGKGSVSPSQTSYSMTLGVPSTWTRQPHRQGFHRQSSFPDSEANGQRRYGVRRTNSAPARTEAIRLHSREPVSQIASGRRCDDDNPVQHRSADGSR
jgi:hypothetical protein